MGWSLDRLGTLGFPPTGRGHLMVSFCRRMAGTAGLDFMGRRILCERALAAEMVSCKLAGYYLLLRARPCCGHSVSFDKFGFCVPQIGRASCRGRCLVSWCRVCVS